jgi:hypothetical protein
MTQRDPGVYLEDIEYYASAAVRFMSGYSRLYKFRGVADATQLSRSALRFSSSYSP